MHINNSTSCQISRCYISLKALTLLPRSLREIPVDAKKIASAQKRTKALEPIKTTTIKHLIRLKCQRFSLQTSKLSLGH